MGYRREVNNKYLNKLLIVLDRYGITYTLEDNNDEDYAHVVTSLSTQEFNRYVERAMCEYESETIHNGRFVISFNELLNYKYELQREFFPEKKGMVYHILSKDKDKLLTLGGNGFATEKNGEYQYAVGDIKLDGIF